MCVSVCVWGGYCEFNIPNVRMSMRDDCAAVNQ